LRVLFLVSAHNSLSQRALVALTERGHEVTVAVVDSASEMEEAVRRRHPELIACPILKKVIPASIWSTHRCLVVHPGPVGDRGASSLDWAIELEMDRWGVTVLEANGELDAGQVWATRSFRTRPVGKSSLYRHEVRRAAIEALVEAVDKVAGDATAGRIDMQGQLVMGRPRPLMKQDVRAIDWHRDSTEVVMRKIRAAEGHPGVLDTIGGIQFHLFGPHAEHMLSGRPGQVIAHRYGAICRATVDGAVWISHLRQRALPGGLSCKLPATLALARAGMTLDMPELAVCDTAPPSSLTYRDIAYEERSGVGYLHFDFYNGAMSTQQCQRLREAYQHARSRRRTKVIVLMGGEDFFSNGIHLNVIEASEDPGQESWGNLNAIDDLVRDIVETGSHLVISALAGDAAAGGVPLALAADVVLAREDIVLNPYYRHMGGLYGSEYWTFLLPRRVGAEMAEALTSEPFTPIGTRSAVEIGLLDNAFGATVAGVHAGVRHLAERLAHGPGLDARLEEKSRRRQQEEQVKPLDAYRREELAQSYECFFGVDRSYHEARRRFVYKLGAEQTAARIVA
jgi:putative two-component system hydrogenase maturation factor HypX/HoxX